MSEETTSSTAAGRQPEPNLGEPPPQSEEWAAPAISGRLEKNSFLGLLMLLVYLGGAFFLTMPCMCLPGAAVGSFKILLGTLILFRLLVAYAVRRMTWKLYGIYVGILVAFCLVADALAAH